MKETKFNLSQLTGTYKGIKYEITLNGFDEDNDYIWTADIFNENGFAIGKFICGIKKKFTKVYKRILKVTLLPFIDELIRDGFVNDTDFTHSRCYSSL